MLRVRFLRPDLCLGGGTEPRALPTVEQRLNQPYLEVHGQSEAGS